MHTIAMCRHTPTLQIMDNRGEAVRSVSYYRAQEDVLSEARITRTDTQHCGRVARQWDPRLFAQRLEAPEARPNHSTMLSLSGRCVHTESVDAGWQSALFSDAGLTLRRFDARGTCGRIDYDVLQRPTAVYETQPPQAEHCLERRVYGDATPSARAQNCCAQLVRHDDTAGSRAIAAYDFNGAPLSESRRLLAGVTANWPEMAVAPDSLLESERYDAHWQYDALGAVLSQTDAGGNTRRMRYSVTGQLDQSTLQQKGQAEQILLRHIVYNAFGQIVTEQTGNGVESTLSYDPQSQRLRESEGSRTGENHGDRFRHLRYQHDPVGNITRIEDLAQESYCANNSEIAPVCTYTYDSLNQLITATGRESVQAGPQADYVTTVGSGDKTQLRNYLRRYSYDDAGNLCRMKQEGANANANANANAYTREMLIQEGTNRSLLKPGPQDLAVDWSRSFDVCGNLLELQTGQALVWNGRNQLSQVTLLGRAAENGVEDDREMYTYDSEGQRVCKYGKRNIGGVMTDERVIYLPGLEIRTKGKEHLHVIAAAAGTSQVRVLHWKDNSGPRDIPNNQYRYSMDDHLGSSQIELGQHGDIISREEYYPFGGTAMQSSRNNKNQTEVKYKFVRYSGKERDATGLYYYGLRYYAPWMHRWINPDPAGAVDGLNLYRMVRNNPLRLVDPNGAKPVDFKTKEEFSDPEKMIKYEQANAYARMLAHPNSDWKTNNVTNIEEQATENIQVLEASIGELSAEESGFLTRLQSSDLHVVHATQNQIQEYEGEIDIMSSEALVDMGEVSRDDLRTKQHGGTSADAAYLKNEGMVFFSLEIGSDRQKQSGRFGTVSYHLPLQQASFENAIVSLSDQRMLRPPSDPTKHIPGLSDESVATLTKRRFDLKSSFFHGIGNMIKGLGLSVIGATRSLTDTGDQERILSATGNTGLSNVINGLFRPEIKAPYLVRTSKFTKHA